MFELQIFVLAMMLIGVGYSLGRYHAWVIRLNATIVSIDNTRAELERMEEKYSASKANRKI